MSKSPEPSDTDYVMVPDIPAAEKAKAEGNELYKAKKYRDAITKYSEAIKLHPQSHLYLGNRAAACIALERYHEALRDSIEACKLDSTYLKGYTRQIKCNMALGNIAAVEAVILEAENNKINANLVFAGDREMCNKLRTYLTSGERASKNLDYRQGSYYFRLASEIAVGSNIILLQQSECMALSGLIGEAQKMTIQVLQKHNTDANAAYVRGLCFYLDDEIDKSLQYLVQALRWAPDLDKAKSLRQKVKKFQSHKKSGNEAFKAQDFQKAIDIYSEALQIDETNNTSNSKLFFNRALARSKMKETDPEKAEERDLMVIDDCDKAINRDENYVKAYRRRGYAYQNISKHDEAVRDFDKVFKLESTRENKQMIGEAKRKQKLSERKDYYKILKISKDANETEIKKAYRKQAMLHHPDRHASKTDEEKKHQEKLFKDVNESFSVLSDTQKRHRYDNGLDPETGGCGGFGGHGGMDIDPNIIFQQFFGGNTAGASRAGNRSGNPFGGSNDFSFSFS